MEEILVDDLAPETQYYIEYLGMDRDDYMVDKSYKNVRKMGTFKRFVPYGTTNVAHFIDIKDVNSGERSSPYPFAKDTMLLSSPPYYFYKMTGNREKYNAALQKGFEKLIDEKTNTNIGTEASPKDYFTSKKLGGRKGRKSRRSRKSRKGRKSRKSRKSRNK